MDIVRTLIQGGGGDNIEDRADIGIKVNTAAVDISGETEVNLYE